MAQGGKLSLDNSRKEPAVLREPGTGSARLHRSECFRRMLCARFANLPRAVAASPDTFPLKRLGAHNVEEQRTDVPVPRMIERTARLSQSISS